MFTLYTAANNSTLVSQLIRFIKNYPLNDVFAKEQFLIQNFATEQWLSQQFAQQFKVWAHYQYLAPSQFFKSITAKIAPLLNEDLPLNSNTLRWQIEHALHHLDNPFYAPLQTYLNAENKALKRYQLAIEIAQLFEKYQQLRPELLNAWQQGGYLTQDPSEKWQQALWLQIKTHQISEKTHWQSAIDTLNNSPIGTFKYLLPQRLFILGVNHLPPLHLNYLNALAGHCDLHFFLQTPSLVPSTHPLIKSLGQQDQGFLHLLQTNTALNTQPLIPLKRTLKNNLQQLQDDIAYSSTQPFFIKLTADDSLSIHACHSKTREIEVLKNVLLAALEEQPELTLRDISVVAPDINQYAPFIRGIFDDIPHTINSPIFSQTHSVAATFIQFLRLINSRFEWPDVLDLLEQELIFPHFDLSITDLATIKRWLADTYVRWGKSAEHKHQLGLPPLNENTWQASMERLLMGYAFATDDVLVDGILPYIELEGSTAQALGGLNDFIQLLFKASDELTTAKSLKDWGERLVHYVDVLMIDDQETQPLYALLTEMDETFGFHFDQPIELSVIIYWLETTQVNPKSAQGLFRGLLNFSMMTAVRGIPFKVIAVLGMNEGDFPSLERTPSFDLLAKSPKQGDPSQRKDDRAQFLQLLMSTEQRLIVTYRGQSQRQNETIPPSVIISELLETMIQNYGLTANDLVIKHPLQPFSLPYFNPQNPKLFSYSVNDKETAQALAEEKQPLAPWWINTLPLTENKIIELDELCKFYRHPQRYFFRRQLGVYLQPLDSAADRNEPFEIDPLTAYGIKDDWIMTLLAQKEFNLEKLQAQGRWLSGVLGEVEFIKQQQTLVAFVQQIQALNLGEPLENLALDYRCGDFYLTGKLYNRYQHGSLFFRYAPLKGKDLLLAWLHHCLINQHEPQRTYIVSKESCFILKSEHQSVEILQTLITLYRRGLEIPDALFVDIALDYAKQVHNLTLSTRSHKSALAVATDKLKLALETSYELEIQRLYGHTDDLSTVFSSEFIEFCEHCLAPLWTSLQTT
ncbi:MAG: exodeoxyribonuclease V subunit gamma [Methylococcales bacterium]|nr:exodeoxyribonuclease V subunit gamma [Methylococcales bacterium]